MDDRSSSSPTTGQVCWKWSAWRIGLVDTNNINNAPASGADRGAERLEESGRGLGNRGCDVTCLLFILDG